MGKEIDQDWKDMWYSNSKRNKLHREIEEDIEWIEQNVEIPLQNRIRQLEERIKYLTNGFEMVWQAYIKTLTKEELKLLINRLENTQP